MPWRVPVLLPSAAGLALLRVAQEALTNARKHAPGAAVSIELRFREESTEVTVTNTAPQGAGGELASSGGGYGLAGLHERIDLLGGVFTAGPHAGGWRVHAEIPA